MRHVTLAYTILAVMAMASLFGCTNPNQPGPGSEDTIQAFVVGSAPVTVAWTYADMTNGQNGSSISSIAPAQATFYGNIGDRAKAFARFNFNPASGPMTMTLRILRNGQPVATSTVETTTGESVTQTSVEYQP